MFVPFQVLADSTNIVDAFMTAFYHSVNLVASVESVMQLVLLALRTILTEESDQTKL